MALISAKLESGPAEGIPCGNPAYTVFRGIPYARPPVGEYRWSAPADPGPWEGVRKCCAFAPAAVQKLRDPGEFYRKEFFETDMPMSEDCLYLNVWTPASSPAEKLPVMVWIHGGGYVQGYSYEMEFDGEAFCKRGVILVTIAYRLGFFGFFAHPGLSQRCPLGVSGNYGALDAIQALKWINKNIEAFGGDPGNVTIFGQSAGGGLVQTLFSSPLAKGLFHKAIVQSASGLYDTRAAMTLEDAERLGAEICGKAGRTIDELLAMPADALQKVLSEANTLVNRENRRAGLHPITDGYVLTDSPGNTIASGRHADVPYMAGSVSGDGRLFSGMAGVDVKTAGEAVIRAVSLISPRSWAEAHLKLGRRPIYTYYFNRDIPGEDHPGAFHSSELWYVFGTLARCWRPMKEVDYGISLAMTDYWANFAKTGDPNGEGLPYWPAFSVKKPLTMVFNENGIKAADLGGDPALEEMEKSLFKRVGLK